MLSWTTWFLLIIPFYARSMHKPAAFLSCQSITETYFTLSLTLETAYQNAKEN